MNEPASMPVCLTIAGFDPSGGAGIIADLHTFAGCGCFGSAVITSITIQNTTGVFGTQHQESDLVRQQAAAVLDDYHVDAVKTGMLPTEDIVHEVVDLLREYSIPNVVVDPVINSTSGFGLITDSALDAMISHLFPLAALITPNVPEAERISGVKIRGIEDFAEAASVIRSFGARNVLIKGGHLPEIMEHTGVATDYLYGEKVSGTFRSEFVCSGSAHGTGCVLSSGIAAFLARGYGLEQAIHSAKKLVTHAISAAPGLGHGNSPLNTFTLPE